MPDQWLVGLGVAAFLLIVVILPIVIETHVFAGITTLIVALFSNHKKRPKKQK